MQWAGEEYLLKEITDESGARMRNTDFLMFHTLSPELAIDNLAEICEKKISDTMKSDSFVS